MDTVLQTHASIPQQLTALLTGAAFCVLDSIGWIRVTGSDRVRWLNGMVTNSVQALTPGHGCYNFALNAQGRIRGIANVFAPAGDPDALLIETSRSELSGLMAHLDHFIIMDDVELKDITSDRFGVLIAGPGAASAIEALALPTPSELLSIESAPWKGSDIAVIRAYSPLVDRFELWTAADVAEPLQGALEARCTWLEAEALESLRILEGTPQYGVDIRDQDKTHDLPQETSLAGTQSRALHFSKGCYLGQEIVERIRSRGSLHRTLSGFELSGSLPLAGTVLLAEGKSAGELTSVATIPLRTGAVSLALGYVRLDALERKKPLTYAGGIAVPVPLPYTPAFKGEN